MKSLTASWPRQCRRGGKLATGARHRLRSACVVSVIASLTTPIAASAQAYQCRMPRTIEAPRIERDGPMRQMPVTGYTLALSWSPEFCRGRETQASQRTQCSGRNGRFGFVVHGLWPESGRSWPQWCATSKRPTGIELARQMCLSPSARLISRQWAKHGSCMVRRPETYFKVTRILWNSLRWPDYDRISRQRGLTAGDIRQAFLDANPGWKHDAIGVKLDSKGWLEEVRLCYSKRFLPTRCDPARFGAKDGVSAKIWRGL